jgi:hypothetical protein
MKQQVKKSNPNYFLLSLESATNSAGRKNPQGGDVERGPDLKM